MIWFPTDELIFLGGVCIPPTSISMAIESIAMLPSGSIILHRYIPFSTRAGCLPGLLRPAAAAGLGSAAPALPGAAPRRRLRRRRTAAAGDAAGAGPGATHAVRWAREDLQDLGKLGGSEDFRAAFGDCMGL